MKMPYKAQPMGVTEIFLDKEVIAQNHFSRY